MSKYTFTVNRGRVFASATRALARLRELQKEGVRIECIHCRNESISLLDLESFVQLEKAERAHNKRQGL